MLKYTKKTILMILFLYPFSGLCYGIFKATIVSLNAPLFKKANISSEVTEYLRKGQIIVVKKNKEKSDIFLETINKNGQPSFILKEHIRIYFKNTNELSFKKPKDSTDYRLEEPLEKSYPFNSSKTRRGSIGFSIGTPLNSRYNYSKKIANESFNNQYRLKSSYSKKVKLDKSGRTYFGGTASISYSNAQLTTFDSYKSNEFQWLLEIGPVISFDSYKSEKFDLTFALAIPINYLRKTVTISDKSISQNKRLFSGFSFSPQLINRLTIKNFFRNLNAYVSGQLTIHPPSSYKSLSKPNSYDSLWSRKDEVILATQTQLFFSVGLSSDF